MTAKGHNTIPWHMECIKNRTITLERKKQELLRLKNEIDRDTAELEYYHLQIDEAVKQGKEKFDHYNFLKKRSPTWNSST